MINFKEAFDEIEKYGKCYIYNDIEVIYSTLVRGRNGLLTNNYLVYYGGVNQFTEMELTILYKEDIAKIQAEWREQQINSILED